MDAPGREKRDGPRRPMGCRKIVYNSRCTPFKMVLKVFSLSPFNKKISAHGSAINKIPLNSSIVTELVPDAGGSALILEQGGGRESPVASDILFPV